MNLFYTGISLQTCNEIYTEVVLQEGCFITI